MTTETLTLNVPKTFDKQALIGIYERYSSDLFRYAYRMLGDNDLAEDCVAETYSRFLGIVRDGKGPTKNVRAYLYRIAHNWITDHYRRQPAPHLPFDAEFHVDPNGNPSTQVSQKMELEHVRSALMRLPQEQRLVIELRFLEEWSHQEVAYLLEKSVEATRALQHRALEALRRMLRDGDENSRRFEASEGCKEDGSQRTR